MMAEWVGHLARRASQCAGVSFRKVGQDADRKLCSKKALRAARSALDVDRILKRS